jgi:uncharacterized protein YuzE
MGAMKVWYDEEGDYFEIRTGDAKGHMKDVGDDMWKRVDESGNIIGFAILGFKKRLKEKNAEIEMPLTVTFS